MEKEPAISVLLPVYNAERYLREAVKSVLAQTFADFELIAVDDGSTDGSLAILREFKKQDPRLQVISRPNTGIVGALNDGLAKCRGKFVARMDADDVCMPERFERQVEQLRSTPGSVCVGCAVGLIDGRGSTIGRMIPPSGHEEINRVMLKGHTAICHPAAMMRTGALREVRKYRQAFYPAEDLDLWLRLGEVGRLGNLPEVLLKYRMHDKSVSEQSGMAQREAARRACEAAWKRRGIEGTFEAGGEWRPGPTKESRFRFALQYGWGAFHFGNRSTASGYALRAIGLRPSDLEGWRLLYCACLKRRSKNHRI